MSRHRPVGWDDAYMALGFLASIGFTAASYVSVKWGVGRTTTEHPPFIPDDWPLKAIQAVYAIEIFYYFALFFIKMSILCLYLRLSTNVFTIITDVVILSLPVPMLVKLQQPRGHRIGLLATFLVGAVATLASCIRLYSVRIYTEFAEALKDAAPINTWSFVEIYLAMLCASVPAFRPLFKDISKNLKWCKSRANGRDKDFEDFEKQERYLPNMKELPPLPEDDSTDKTDKSLRRDSGRDSGEDLLVKKPEPVAARFPRISHSEQELYRSVGHDA